MGAVQRERWQILFSLDSVMIFSLKCMCKSQVILIILKMGITMHDSVLQCFREEVFLCLQDTISAQYVASEML